MSMTIDEFWTEVAKIGWGNKTLDHRHTQKKLALLWSPEKAEDFYEVFHACRNKLYRAIEVWEKENNKRLDCSDDGLSDLTSHIVGLGEAEFALVLANPQRAYVRAAKCDYRESFAYVVPNGKTLSDAMDHIPQWKAVLLKQAEVVREVLPSAVPLLTEVLDMVERAGSLPLSNEQIRARHKEIAKLAANCSYSGPLFQISSAQEALSFFSGWEYVNYVTDMQDWARARLEAAAE